MKKKTKKHYAQKGKTKQAPIFDWLDIPAEQEKPKQEGDKADK